MRTAFAIALCMMLACCSTVTFYAPESDVNISRGGNACSTVIAYQVPLGDTIRLSVHVQPRAGGLNITVAFRVPRGESIQLLSPEFVIHSDGGAPTTLNIAYIDSGSTALGIPIVRFAPTEPLLGVGRYGQLEPPYGPDDIFLADLTLATTTRPSRLEVLLPKMQVKGRAVTTSPMSFVLRSETRALCIQ